VLHRSRGSRQQQGDTAVDGDGGLTDRRESVSNTSPTALLLNVGHGLDHLFLLIFATAVAAIAAEWGMAWPDLMPYTAGAFVMFGVGSLPAGRLGDLWGRRAMMVTFFLGIGLSGLLIAMARGPWTLAGSLTLMGVFASIYHPVGIPMLVQNARRPGFTIGVNGLAGNLGIAGAAVLTGFLVQQFGWRMAFAVPGLVSLGCAALFAALVPGEEAPPARRSKRSVDLPPAVMMRVFLVMSLAAVSGSMIFNFTTNGNGQLLAERLRGLVDDPASLGALLAAVYTVASFAQIVVGRLIDRFPLKWIYLPIVAAQVPLFLLAANATGWLLYAVVLAFMVFVFGAIPFIDAMIVQYVDDRMRSRVAGMRLAVSFGVSSLAVYLLGPAVKTAGFATLLIVMAGISALTTVFVSLLPERSPSAAPAALPAPQVPA
jgi:MFS family permease